MTPARRRAEGGYTLTEVLVAVTILTTAIVVIVGAMSAGILGSRVHRDIVTSDAVARTYADQLIAGPYVACATPATAQYQLANPPSGFTTRIAVQYWNAGSNNPATFGAGPCTVDAGSQQITVSVSRTNGSGLQTVQFVKRQP